VDSALVYRGLDVGAAKPTKQEMSGIPHALIDIRDPSEPYSAADFAKDAMVEVERIVANGRVPILAGGTMLYFKALLEGLSDIPAADPLVREQIERDASQRGWPNLHAELARVDPVSAERIHPNHSQRIGRALEVWRQSGKPISAWQSADGEGLLDRYSCVQIALYPSNRSLLHRRIEQRWDSMIEQNFIDEVIALRNRGDLNKDLPAIRAVGYRQVWEHLDGEYGFDEMAQRALAATRQLAKRQLTWLRSWPDLYLLEITLSGDKMKESEEIVQELLGFYRKSTI
jgi:tRNA dimethylallyltransferase